MRRLRGSTNQRRFIFIADTSSTTGAGLANLTHSSSGLVAYYIAGDLSNEVQITPLVAGTLGTYVSGGFVAVDNTNMPGWYEIGIPDAALDGGNQVAIQYRGATNMAPVNIYIDLDAVDYQTDAFGALKPTTAGRTLDVTATGAAGIDLGNVENQGSTLNLSATSIKTAIDVETDTQDIQARLPAALVDGRMVSLAQAVTDKSGYTLSQAFPSNFNVLSIDANGKVLLQPVQTGVTIPTVTTVDELGASALTANGAGDFIAGYVWDEPYNQHTQAGTFGKLMDILRKANTLIEGTVTSAITPTAGSFSTNVNYTTGAFNHSVMLFTSGALTEQNSPILTYVNTNGVITVEQAFTAAPQVGDAFVIVPTSHVHSLAAIADQVWDETLSGHLASGSTGEALNNSGGSGNPWITDLSTGYTGTQAGNILNQVKAKTDLITTGTIQSSIPVTSQGQITGPLFIGDDYLSANGRAFQWTVALPSGFVIATSTCRFGMEHAEGATEGASFAVSGTVTDAGSGNVTLSFDVPKATTGALKAGFYRWSVEIASASGNEVTRVASDGKKLVEWREKQT